MAVAACTNDEFQEVVDMQKPVAQKTISVKAYTPTEQAATRLDFEEGTEELKLSWSEGDAFTAVIGEDRVTFTYDTENEEFTAYVDENFELPNGAIAYYPAYNADEFVKDFSIQTGTLNSATTYMEGVYNGDAFSFNHSTAILKASFSGLPQNAVISSIQISGAVDITIDNFNSSAAAYINLPAIPKDGQLKFMVETTTRDVYIATQTVKIEGGIKTGVFYAAPIALVEAPVCELPTGDEFNSAVKTFLEENPSLTQIKFIVNSESPATRSESNDENATEDETYRLVAGNNNTLEIHTAAFRFIFNADCMNMFNGLSKIISIDFNDCVNTAKVTTMRSMFNGCKSLASLDLGSFNFSMVTTFSDMFVDLGKEATNKPISVYVSQAGYEMLVNANDTGIDPDYAQCVTFCALPTGREFNGTIEPIIGSATTIVFEAQSSETGGTQIGESSAYAKVDGTILKIYTAAKEFVFNADCSCMFNTRVDLIDPNNFSNITLIDFNDCINTSNVTDMSSMFVGCMGLTSLDVSGFNTSNVTDMSDMFGSCWGLTSLDLSNFNTSNVTDMSYMFAGCSALSSLDLSNFNTESVESMGSMFNGCSALTSLNVSGFNTLKVMDMNYMFIGCSALTSLDVSGFNTSNVTDMGAMFCVCSSLISLDVRNFDTSNVTSMESMFNGCSSLTSLDVSDFNTSKVWNMASMFNSCSSLTSLDLSSFVPSSVTDMSWMFNGCSALTSLNLSNFNTESVESMSFMFNGCSSLTSLDLSNYNTESVKDMSFMFNDCSALTSLDLSNFNTESVESMGSMFNGCSSLTSLDVSGFNTSSVKDMNSMFNGCSSLSSLDLSSFVPSSVMDMGSMFNGCSSLTSLDVSNFNTENVVSMSYMFFGCSSLTSLDLSNFNFGSVGYFTDMFASLGFIATSQPIPVYVKDETTKTLLEGQSTGISNDYAQYVVAASCTLPKGSDFNRAIIGVQNFANATTIVFEAQSSETGGTQIGESSAYAKVNGNTLKIYTAAKEFVFNADCSGMFNDDGSNAINKLNEIISIDFNDCVNTSSVTNMSKMFAGCSYLESLDLNNFDTSNVTDMSYMFEGCSHLASLKIRSFDTSSVTNMHAMFTICGVLTSLDVSNFDTSSVTDMGNMFGGCNNLTSLDVSDFNTSSVTNMNAMFAACSRLTSLDVSNFDTSSVMNMSYMFQNCSKLTSLDLSSFNFSEVTNFSNMFKSLGSAATSQPIPVWVKDENDEKLLEDESTSTGIDSSYAQIVVK